MLWFCVGLLFLLLILLKEIGSDRRLGSFSMSLFFCSKVRAFRSGSLVGILRGLLLFCLLRVSGYIDRRGRQRSQERRSKNILYAKKLCRRIVGDRELYVGV